MLPSSESLASGFTLPNGTLCGPTELLKIMDTYRECNTRDFRSLRKVALSVLPEPEKDKLASWVSNMPPNYKDPLFVVIVATAKKRRTTPHELLDGIVRDRSARVLF